jgi:hypothetical protein
MNGDGMYNEAMSTEEEPMTTEEEHGSLLSVEEESATPEYGRLGTFALLFALCVMRNPSLAVMPLMQSSMSSNVSHCLLMSST